jgi:hypothetical protein
MNGNTFLRISDFILVEYQYSTDQLLESSNRFISYSNAHDKSISLVNWINSRETTGNTEELLFVDTDDSFKAIVDITTAFYYPNHDDNVVGTNIPTSVGYLSFDTIRIHIRSGYNFQNDQGFLMRLFLESNLGDEINLLAQTYFKSDLSMIKYNRTPISISEVSFDKYVEFKVLNSFDILDNNNQNNNNEFMKQISKVKYNPMIFAEFSLVSRISTESGYMKLSTGFNDIFSIPLKDSFSELSAYLAEVNNSYFEYSALWNGNPIEDYIYSLNSVSGNDFIVEHQISVYEQRGMDFINVENFIRRQESNFNDTLKYRPVISNYADGSLQIEYVCRLFNRNDGISVTKSASINSTNINSYSQEPMRIAVDLNPTLKVYNKVVKKEISGMDVKNPFENKIVVPMYFESSKVFVGSKDAFEILLVPFDNIYEINLVKEFRGQEVPYPIDISTSHYLVFKDDKNIVRVKENSNSDKSNGILNFMISTSQSESILRMKNNSFYINILDEASEDVLGYETNLATGNWIEKGKSLSVPNVEDSLPVTFFDPPKVTISPAPTETPTETVKVIDTPSTIDPNEFTKSEILVLEPALEKTAESPSVSIPVIQTDELISIKETLVNSNDLLNQRLNKEKRKNIFR